MELIEVRPDDVEAVAAFVSLENEAAAVGWPWEHPMTPHRQRMEMIHGFEGEGDLGYLAVQNGERVGAVLLYKSEYDNLDAAWVLPLVRPSLRRRGLGKELLELAEAECRRLGRTLLSLVGWDDPGLCALAASAGYEERSVDVRRIQRLDGSGAERERFAALHAEAAVAAADYELVRFRGRTPEEILPELLAVTDAINDAPTDDLEIEDEVFDLGRIRAYETAQVESGHRLLRLVARHRESGAFAGHTVVVVDGEQPDWAEQHDTTVLREHRGHRLGLFLKSGMLLWLAEEEPQVRNVATENAESNDPMIGVNEQIGMRLAGRMPVFQRRL